MVIKTLKWTLIVVAIVFAGIQFVRPARTNPAIDDAKTLEAKINVTPEVAAILVRSCDDCHSNKTEWIWYTNVAPISWYIAHHVDEGRRELSFSEFGSYSDKKAVRKLEEICEQVKSGEMPHWDYAILHPTANLSETDKQILCDWTKREQEKLETKIK